MSAGVLGWVITGVLAIALVAFIGFLVASARYPDERPKVATYDRAGRRIADRQNPGAEIAPGRSGDVFDSRD